MLADKRIPQPLALLYRTLQIRTPLLDIFIIAEFFLLIALFVISYKLEGRKDLMNQLPCEASNDTWVETKINAVINIRLTTLSFFNGLKLAVGQSSCT